MNIRPTLICTVRNCKAALTQELGRVSCANSHSFDIARSGYINLLQPQDRRSKEPGDTVAAILARRAVHESGITHPLLNAVATALAGSEHDVVLEIGSGDGFYLGSLEKQFGFTAQGLDISLRAADISARRYPACQWIVANADRFIPYQDGSFSRVMSLTSRMNPAEFHRVLRPDGKLLIALPAPDDLIELRGSGRDRTGRTIQDFAPRFKLVDQSRATTAAELDASSIENVLRSIYRPMHTAPVRVGPVTFSLDLLLFEPNNPQ